MQTLAGRGRFVVAHGAGNDLARLRAAESLGVDVVEADVRLFRGRLEVRHAKTVGPLPIFWDKWRLEDPPAPRLELDGLLAAVSPSTRLLLDLKGRDARLSEHVLGVLARRPSPARPIICARGWHLLEPFRRRGFDTVHSVGTAAQLRTLVRLGRPLGGVSIHRKLLDPQIAGELRRLAGVVLSWPVDTVELARRLVDWGVQGVITDAPDVAGWVAGRQAATAR